MMAFWIIKYIIVKRIISCKFYISHPELAATARTLLLYQDFQAICSSFSFLLHLSEIFRMKTILWKELKNNEIISDNL